MRRRTSPLGDLSRLEAFESILTQAFGQLHDSIPGADLRLARRSPQPAALHELRLDKIVGAEISDLADCSFGHAHQSQRLVVAERFEHRGKLWPPRQHKTAIAPRCTAAADVALQNHDVAGGTELLDAQRGPQAPVPAADDSHIRTGVAG